ncbi:hypothetical protein [Acidisphaera sp. S103]|uniref:hypothetical protein n=1 Tax=Acidisphaera sp. S103 TaxID=1747223 RepID=UPI00131CC8ED|nr:hypothetical protein [Acidisphaera sp. S103]
MSTSLKAKPVLPSFSGSTLLDQIELKHGPIALLGRFFLLAEQAARDRGVHLRLHTDMDSLAEIYPEVTPGRSLPVLSTFDPAHSDLSPKNAFWISGHDDSGKVIATQAARLFDMTRSTVERELVSMRLFYAAPEKYLAAGARCLVDCPPANDITGRVVYSGGAIYHPKVRGCGLSRILPRISRALAHSMWDSEYTFSTVETLLIAKDVHRSYGYTRHSELVSLRGTNRGAMDFGLIWMPTGEMLEDLTNYTSETVGNEVRNTETTDTNWPPSRRQGSSNRS